MLPISVGNTSMILRNDTQPQLLSSNRRNTLLSCEKIHTTKRCLLGKKAKQYSVMP